MVNYIQPTIIVIPYKAEGQKYRSILENPSTGFQKRSDSTTKKASRN